MATDFQRQVWAAIACIPRGRVTTYGAIARYLGTRGVRAVGTAVGRNPYAPEVPCHRVVRETGQIGHYSGEGGVPAKRALLAEEGIRIVGEKIVDFEKIRWDYPSHSVTSPFGS